MHFPLALFANADAAAGFFLGKPRIIFVPVKSDKCVFILINKLLIQCKNCRNSSFRSSQRDVVAGYVPS
jgi:hypothetical protein